MPCQTSAKGYRQDRRNATLVQAMLSVPSKVSRGKTGQVVATEALTGSISYNMIY